MQNIMTLEDFFTLTEMKDGLTVPSRVQELVFVMQKEKDCAVKNVGDMTRQWASVASTIAATETKDCLDLFIQLDGLWFINKWLKEAQNFEADTNYSFVEESITAMLRAVEKLHLDSEKLVSSGLHTTISNLLDHHSSRVQDRARVLFDSWKEGGNSDSESHDMELDKVNNSSEKTVSEEGQPSALNEAGNDNDHASGDASVLRSTDNLLPENKASVLIQSSDNMLQSSVSMECEDIKERSPKHLAGVPSSQEVAPINEGLPSCTAGETTSVGTCNFPVPDQGSFEGQPDVALVSDLDKKEKQELNVNNCPPEKLGAPEICSLSSKVEHEPVFMGASEAKTLESGKEPALEHNVENNEDGISDEIMASGSTSTTASERSGADDIRALNSITQHSKAAENDDNCCSNAWQDSSVSGSNLGNTEVLEMSISGKYVTAVKEGNGHIYNDGKDKSNGSDSSKLGKDSRGPKIINMKGSDHELDSGILDAIEVARQVAQEVEREVCCSSSDKISESRRRPGSPDSVRKEDVLTQVPGNEVSSRRSHSAGACSEGNASISDNVEAEPECRSDVVSLQMSEAARDSGVNCDSEKHLCAFDLNEVSDDMDVSVNTLSTPVPVVLASRLGPTPELPGAPLQFEGILGQKESDATSVSRPSSLHKNCDNERKDWLDIDLNVAEGEKGLVKPTAESSGDPLAQSSVELSPQRSRRFELDLNSIGDDGSAQPSDHWKEGQLFLGRNGYWSPSPASSSSSMQPSVRNIDLNDRPFLQTDLVDQGPGKSSQIIDALGHSKSSDAPMISILGAKVEVGRKEPMPQTLSLANGKAIEPAIDLTMSRTGGVLGMHPSVSYNPSAVFGYNGVAQASVSAPALSFSSSIYGSGGAIPYMVDSRGAPVIPQVGGSSTTVLSSHSQSPIIMSMTGTQLGLNGFGPSRPNFDLNSGFMIDGGNRDTLATRQYFFPSQGRTMEEHIRSMPQPSSSGVGGKRKEPDGGWESYPFSYKHQQPPWK